MKPDWTKAPKEPKAKPIHWDTRNEHFCDVDGWWDKAGEYHAIIWGHWGTDRFTPRPIESKDKAELEDCSSKTEKLIMTEPDWTKADCEDCPYKPKPRRSRS